MSNEVDINTSKENDLVIVDTEDGGAVMITIVNMIWLQIVRNVAVMRNIMILTILEIDNNYW